MDNKPLVSRSFMRRLVRRLMRGYASMFPSYMMYFDYSQKMNGFAAGLDGSAIPLDTAMVGSTIENDAKANGSWPGQSPPTSNGKSVSFVKSGPDITPGLKSSLVLRNLYMSYSSDQEKLQTQASIPCIVQDLDYSYPADWANDSLTNQPTLNWDLKLKAVSSSLDMTKEAKKWIEHTWRAQRGYDGSYSSIPERNMNPYYSVWNWFSSVVTNPSGSSIVSRYTMDKRSSDLKNAEAGQKGLRFIGSVLGYMPTQCGVVDAAKLKIDFNATEPFSAYNPNPYDQYIKPYLNPGCEIVYMQSDRQWFAPVVAQRSGTTPSTAVFGPMLKPLSHNGAMNPYGFTSATTDISVTSSQLDYKMKYVVNFRRGGPVGKAEYVLEKYLSDLIENNLTCHLPDDINGAEIPYFTNRGKWAGHSFFGSDTQIGSDYTTTATYIRACLGPVAYPAAQCPDSPWLWFVSEDEDDNFWLNKLKMGYATRAIAVTKLNSPPIQMEVDNTNVVMVYSDRISQWNISSSKMTSWVCGDSIGNFKLTSVAIDRFTGHYWFGHSSGAFLFNDGTVAEIPTSTWVGSSCARQGLTACNGYIAWSPVDTLELKGEYVFRHNSYACWWDSNKGVGRALTFDELLNNCSTTAYFMQSKYSGVYEQFIGRVAVRSNGELIVTHTPQSVWSQSRNDSLTMTIVAFDANLNAIPVNTADKWTLDKVGNDSPGYVLYLLPLKVVSDVKVIGGLVTVPNVIMMNNANYQWQSGLTNGITHRSMLVEVTIDDDNNVIHSHMDFGSANIPTYGKQLNMYSSTGNYFDRVNYPSTRYSIIDYLGAQMALDKIQHALDSLCVIQLKQSFAVLFSGQQDPATGGMPLSWSGSNWTLPTAGKPIIGRKTDGTAHSVDTDTTVTFSQSVTYAGQSAYGFVCMPSTSDSPKISVYFGDFIESTETIQILSVNTALGCRQIDSFVSVDTDRTDLMKCVINGTSLTFVSGTPGTSEFSVTANGHMILSNDHVGSTATVTYAYIAQGT